MTGEKFTWHEGFSHNDRAWLVFWLLVFVTLEIIVPLIFSAVGEEELDPLPIWAGQIELKDGP